MKNKKNLIIIILLVALSISIGFNIKGSNSNVEEPLPKQEKSEGLRGVYDIDKNINEKTIDNYLGRSDTVYVDVRMLDDPAPWENKGGERMLTGFIEGFEVIPYPFLTAFPEEYVKQKEDENVVGLYVGDSLFHIDEAGNYVANYKESMDILEFMFPKDKYIFIICGAGGYANFTKQMLVSLGWDKEKIYNIGGYWHYEGNKGISTVNNYGDEVKYDFWKVSYHDIDFDNLTPVE
ncbi:MAG: hypothetical protein GX368_00925 [Erysipelotrichaceae bacterium]|nr:hypothetical protein [Erysipelotrichaceae bacterium]